MEVTVDVKIKKMIEDSLEESIRPPWIRRYPDTTRFAGPRAPCLRGTEGHQTTLAAPQPKWSPGCASTLMPLHKLPLGQVNNA